MNSISNFYIRNVLSLLLNQGFVIQMLIQLFISNFFIIQVISTFICNDNENDFQNQLQMNLQNLNLNFLIQLINLKSNSLQKYSIGYFIFFIQSWLFCIYFIKIVHKICYLKYFYVQHHSQNSILFIECRICRYFYHIFIKTCLFKRRIQVEIEIQGCLLIEITFLAIF
ncbi:unnamed protein product [Paramecium primaurelia]|uniref:Transmembrane protein n=1 Tax=Paramecium primaurelia TaxID=5886 RepID=A0A8S1QMB4_PARPR|nr:unnamed protein product [Paramecium primaurelia]